MFAMNENGCPYAHKLGFFTKTDFNNNNRVNAFVSNDSGGYITTSISKSTVSFFDYTASGMFNRGVMWFNPAGYFVLQTPTGSEDSTQSEKTWGGIFQSSAAGAVSMVTLGNSRGSSCDAYYPQNSSGYTIYFANVAAGRRYSRPSINMTFPGHQVHSYNGSGSSLARAYIYHNDSLVRNYNTMLENPVSPTSNTQEIFYGYTARTHGLIMFYRHFDQDTQAPFLNGYLKYLRRG
ncbi:hypothetical protein [Microcystis phage Mel-JY01]